MDPILGYAITGVISLIVGLALQRFVDKPKLQFFLPGQFLFELKEPNVKLQTDSLTLQNSGRKSATNIEIVHKETPDHFQFSQAIGYSEEINPNGEHIIKISSLGPKEFLNIQYLSHTKVPNLLRVRSDQGSAELIQVQFQPLYPLYFKYVAGILMLSGVGLLIYWSLKVVYYVSEIIVTSSR